MLRLSYEEIQIERYKPGGEARSYFADATEIGRLL
jgi:hypothetical protein